MKEQQNINLNVFSIEATVIRLRKLIRLNFVQDFSNTPSPIYLSILTEILIKLNFLLFKSSTEYGKRIDFRDDVDYIHLKPKGKYENDITGLIHFYRDAICHPDAISKPETTDKKQYVYFYFQTGSAPFKRDGIKHLCKYQDDIAVIVGDNLLYIKRHVARAYDEVSQYLINHSRFSALKIFIKTLTDNGD